MSVIERRTEWTLHTCQICGDVRSEDPCLRCGDDGIVRSIAVIEKQRAEDAIQGAVDAAWALNDAIISELRLMNDEPDPAVLWDALERFQGDMPERGRS